MTTDSDALVRSIEKAALTAGPATAALVSRNDADLFCALGQLTAGSHPEGGQDLKGAVDIDNLSRTNALEELGRRIFHRWNVVLHQFVCTPAQEDQAVRQKLLEALNSKGGTAVALIAGILVASFGVSPAVAAIVATLLVRLLIDPTADELCKYWSERIRG